MKFIALALPKFSFLAYMVKKPLVVFLTIPTTIAVTPVVDVRAAAWVLFGFFMGDLATGIYASYCVWKAKPVKKDNWFFGKGEGFCSDKFKKMGIKGIVYLGLPFFLIKFQQVFMIKNIRYETLSDAELTLPTFFILLFCLNEGFSIFHENLPKCGFSIYDRFKKMFGFYKKVKKDLNE